LGKYPIAKWPLTGEHLEKDSTGELPKPKDTFVSVDTIAWEKDYVP